MRPSTSSETAHKFHRLADAKRLSRRPPRESGDGNLKIYSIISSVFPVHRQRRKNFLFPPINKKRRHFHQWRRTKKRYDKSLHQSSFDWLLAFSLWLLAGLIINTKQQPSFNDSLSQKLYFIGIPPVSLPPWRAMFSNSILPKRNTTPTLIYRVL